VGGAPEIVGASDPLEGGEGEVVPPPDDVPDVPEDELVPALVRVDKSADPPQADSANAAKQTETMRTNTVANSLKSSRPVIENRSPRYAADTNRSSSWRRRELKPKHFLSPGQPNLLPIRNEPDR
jgi:hypothetical protein